MSILTRTLPIAQARERRKIADGRCGLFQWPVLRGEYCDSYSRGKPGTDSKDVSPSQPKNLHMSQGKNHCSDCEYFFAGSNPPQPSRAEALYRIGGY
jgi:hypothetical protein